MIDIINSLPDDLRFAIFPIIRIIGIVFGITIWEDGSAS